jgi:DNA-binding NarL/FixJ family response regulator
LGGKLFWGKKVMVNTKRVVIVEDHEDIQVLYSIIIRRIQGVSISAQFYNAEEASEALSISQPDLIIIDISLPGKNGIEFAAEVREKYPKMKILIATGYDPDFYFKRALAAGVDDYIIKGETQQIIEKIKKLLGV